MGRCWMSAAVLALAACAGPSPDPAPDGARVARAALVDGGYEIVVENPGTGPVRGTCLARFYDSEGRRLVRGRDPRAAFDLAPGARVSLTGTVPFPETARVEALIEEELP